MTHKKTLVMGATEHTSRYAYLAATRLLAHGHEIVLLGNKPGQIENVPIETEPKAFEGIHTITMYLNAQRQKAYHDYILSLKPARIIFNPGAENPELAALAEKNNIEVVEGCTLVMLSIGNY